MKHTIALFLTVTMLLSLTACDRQPEDSSSDLIGETSTNFTGETSESSTAFKPVFTVQEYFETVDFFDSARSQTVHYLFHEPMRDTGTPSPLVIFLHGLGDTVNENYLGTATQFVDSLIRLENDSATYSTYTLVPSTPLAHEGNWTSKQLTSFKKLLFQLIDTYNIDPKRIYITGISMGGFVTCQLVSEMGPNMFAAAVPLSGASNMTNPKERLNTAFRIYHSKEDAVVSVTCSRNLYAQLTQAGHEKVEYIEFEFGDHISPLYDVYVYQRDSFFSWLFEQRLP